MSEKIVNKIKHLVYPGWWAQRQVPAPLRTAIEAAIRGSEKLHRGEIRFAAEGALPLAALSGSHAVRDRALAVFSELRVWDTEENTGVLIYVQLIEREFAIVADRGINSRVPQTQWNDICKRMEAALRAGRFEDGVLAGLRDVSALLAQHFPARSANANELSDRPVVR